MYSQYQNQKCIRNKTLVFIQNWKSRSRFILTKVSNFLNLMRKQLCFVFFIFASQTWFLTLLSLLTSFSLELFDLRKIYDKTTS